MKILDFGCGTNKTKGAIGIDIDPRSDADVVADLTHFPYPFRDSTFDLIVCKQILEHLPDLGKTFEEFHRLLKPGGRVYAESPHFSNFYVHGDPTHRRAFSYTTPEYFTRKGLFKIVQRRITFHRAFRWWAFHVLANRFPIGYERFWTFICPAEHLHFELGVNKTALDFKERKP